MDIADVIGHAEALSYGDEVDAMICNMRTQGFEIALGIRHLVTQPGSRRTAMSYVVTVPVGSGERTIAVAKTIRPAI
jgi:hypothetical protein